MNINELGEEVFDTNEEIGECEVCHKITKIPYTLTIELIEKATNNKVGKSIEISACEECTKKARKLLKK